MTKRRIFRDSSNRRAWCDDIVIVDSFSADATAELANRENVRFVEHEFENYSRQRNWALRNIDFKHDWVFSLDTDERMTPELRAEIEHVLERDKGPDIVAYRVRYLNLLWGHCIKRSTLYPTWLIRLMKPRHLHYEDRAVHAHPVVDGAVGELRKHYSFNQGISAWLAKHNSYSSLEAVVSASFNGVASVAATASGARTAPLFPDNMWTLCSKRPGKSDRAK